MARILVPNLPGVSAGAGIKALSQEGDTCDLAWHLNFVWRHFFLSKHVNRFYQITSAADDDTQFAQDVIDLCRENDYDLLLPFGNDSCYAVVKHAEEIGEHIPFMLPEEHIFNIAHDKLQTTRFCEKIGIDAPRVYTDYTDNDLDAIAKEVTYPVVVKARSGALVDKGLRYANSRDELLAKYEEITSFTATTGARDYDAPLIQEFIPGFIHDVCSLTDHGEVVNLLTQVRQVMYPIYGGVGAVNVTTDDPRLAELARRLLTELEWHGPAQIEFKYDPRDGRYKLIEINPKLWGTLDLSIKVGMNFPGMIRNLIMGRPVERNRDYPANVRYNFRFPQSTLAKLQMLKEFGIEEVRHLRQYEVTHHDLDWQDLRPDLVRIFYTIGSLLSGQVTNVNANLERRYINRTGDNKFMP
ncbi:MAG: ATP-grasp domain-containing protein [Anaerolineae bacterium]|nr:ATP-grasp domain-containing protein [Anaerolineae bacterium]